MSRVILHIDMDAFFAAVEQRDDPSLAGKPVIIGALPGSRGVVSTASYEARKYGVHSAMPIAQAYKRCPQGVYLSPDGRKYFQISKQIKAILQDITPRVQMASVDEAYLDITGCEKLHGTPRQTALLVKEQIRKQLQLGCSVGMGPNRLIAKIASDIDKPDGLTIVMPEDLADFLAPLEVGRIPGIGKQTNKVLAKLGIKLIGQLASIPKEILVERFGEKGGESLYRKSHGISSDFVGEGEGRKSISKERTFGVDETSEEKLRHVLLKLSGDIGRQLRKENRSGRCLTLKIRLEGFETHTCSKTIDKPTDADDVIFNKAWDLYRQSAYTGRPVRLIGVGVSDFDSEARVQLDLFEQPKKQKTRSVYQAMDAIRDKFGSNSIKPADAYDGNVNKEKVEGGRKKEEN